MRHEIRFDFFLALIPESRISATCRRLSWLLPRLSYIGFHSTLYWIFISDFIPLCDRTLHCYNRFSSFMFLLVIEYFVVLYKMIDSISTGLYILSFVFLLEIIFVFSYLFFLSVVFVFLYFNFLIFIIFRPPKMMLESSR